MAHIKKYRFHYAWTILAAACVLNIFARADQGSFGVFVDPMVELFGWKRGDISFAYSLAFLVGLPTVVVMGWLGDRYGGRKLMLGAAILIGAGTVLMGAISELWQFYVVYGFMVGSMGHAAFSVLLPVMITRWFYQRLGIVMGIYFACQGLGPVIFAPLFSWSLDTHGWQPTFTWIGLGLGCILTLFALLIYDKPEALGLKAYGIDDTPAQPHAAVASSAAPVRLRDILKQRIAWKLAAIHHLGCVAHSIILAHVVSMAIFKGVPGLTAAGVLAAIAGASVISRFAFSVMTDKFGGRTTLTLALLGQSLPVIILFFATDAWTFYLFAVVFGLCYGGEMVGFPIINKQLFGAKAPLGSIYSFEMVGGGTGMALGGWLGGSLFDLSGAYEWSLVASLTIGLVGLPLALSLPRHKRASTVPV